MYSYLTEPLTGGEKLYRQEDNILKIFLSHASQFKPTVKNLIKYLPANISTWLDEGNLIWGDKLTPTFETAIKTEVDYVVVFINELAGRSPWVQNELRWALEHERELKRSFVLPVFLRSEGDDVFSYFPDLVDRKNIQVYDYTEFGLKTAADQLTANLFSLICEDLSRMQTPAPVNITQTISKAEELITSIATIVRTVIFPHRKENPISIDELYEKVFIQSSDINSPDEFEELLGHIISRNMIPGLSYDGYELYLVEEHSQWKAELNREKKINIARKAASHVKSGMKVYIDAGSTSEQVINILCKRIKMHTLTNLTLVTPSINHADLISACCVHMGFDDDSSAVHLYIPGGYVRPATQAVIPYSNDKNDLEEIPKVLGGYDLAIIGANGISEAAGLTTHANTEIIGKKLAFDNAKKRIMICDDSKVNIVLDHQIASFADDFTLISNKNPILEDMQTRYPDKILLV